MDDATDSALRTDHATLFDRSFLVDVCLIALLWFAGTAIVHPIGDFPLNDDWVFGWTVRRLLETAEYHPSGWAAMTMATNVFWGALFCLPGPECSFTTLRISTLIASFLCLIGTYLLIRDLRQPRWLALVITFTLAFNPIYYALSYTFMTDVPYTAISIWSAVFLARSLKSGSTGSMLIGTVLAIGATLSRQIALSIPLAFAVAMLLRSRFSARALFRAAIPLLFCAGAWLAFTYWLEATERMPAQYYNKNLVLVLMLTKIKPFLTFPFEILYTVLLYLGLFLLPVSLLWFKSTASLFDAHRRSVLTMIAAGLLVMVAGAVIITVFGPRHLYSVFIPGPLGGNILVRSGLGPLHLRDGGLNPDHMSPIPTGFWIIVTALGFLGTLMLIVKLSVHAVDLGSRLRRHGPVRDNEIVGVFLLLCGGIYLLPLLGLGPYFYDRYLIPVTVFVAVGIAALSKTAPQLDVSASRSARLAATVLLIAFGIYSICGTRDYLEWNRVRWQALTDLMRQNNIDATSIDGGYEFNGLYLYDPQFRASPGKSWYWVHDDTYEIAFGTRSGYKVLKEYPYYHWLPPHMQKLVVLQRE